MNPNFGTFSLAPSPPVSLRLQILFASNNNDKFYLENVYIAYIDVTPTVFVREGAIFDILITNSDYSFSGTCENGEVVCASGAAGCEAIPRLDSSSCSVDPLNSRKIRFTYEGDVQVGKKFRINLNVKNPSRLSVPSDIIVLSVSKRSNLIYEKGYLEESLRCGQVILAQPVIKYLWGVTQKTLEPCPIGLYVPLGNDYPFNNIRIFFRFNGKTSSTLAHRIVAKFNSIYSVLDGSIIHNLPNFGNVAVNCVYSNQVLTCDNIGNMAESDSLNYFIGFRFQLQTNIGSLDASKFGGLQIFTIDPQGFSNPLSVEVYPATQVKQESSDYMQTSANGYHQNYNLNTGNVGLLFAASVSESTAFDNYAFTTTLLGTSGRAGIKLSSDNVGQAIVLLLQPAAADLANTNGLSMLMKIVFNNANFGIATTDLPKGISIHGGWMNSGASSCAALSSKCLNYNVANNSTFWNKIN